MKRQINASAFSWFEMAHEGIKNSKDFPSISESFQDM